MHKPDYSGPRIEQPNYWYKFLELNKASIKKENKFIFENFTETNKTILCPFSFNESQDINFKLDGFVGSDYQKVVTDIKKKKPKTLTLDITDDTRFFFFYNTEGECSDEIFDLIYWLINVHDIPHKNVTYQNIACNIDEMHEQYCKKKKISKDERISTQYINTYNNSKLLLYIKPKALAKVYKNIDNKKLALCLNWAPRTHRFLTIAMILHESIPGCFNLTVPTNDTFNYDLEKDWELMFSYVFDYYQNNESSIFKCPPEFTEFYYNIGERYKVCYPFIIDDRRNYKSVDESIYTEDLNTTPGMRDFIADVKMHIAAARKNSLFELVTETHADGPIVFTEKTFWPIQEGIPFLQVNSPGSLKKLREMGYLTFSKYIDESYDDETDLEKRIRKIVREIKRLNQMRQDNPTRFDIEYNDMLIIAQYNKDIFEKTGYDFSNPDFIKS